MEEAEERKLAKWVRLCGIAEAPAPGTVAEAEVEGTAVCIANVDGELSALDNVCPHRQGPLGQGWIERDCVVCPWHSWTFHVKTGQAEFPPDEKVAVFPLRVEGDDVMIELK